MGAPLHLQCNGWLVHDRSTQHLGLAAPHYINRQVSAVPHVQAPDAAKLRLSKQAPSGHAPRHGRRKLAAASTNTECDAAADACAPPITNSLFWEGDADAEATGQGSAVVGLLCAEQLTPAQRLRRTVATCSALQGPQHTGGAEQLPESQFLRAAGVLDTLTDLTLAVHAPAAPAAACAQDGSLQAASTAAARMGRRGVPQRTGPAPAAVMGLTGRGVPAEGNWSDACSGRHAPPMRAVQPGRPVNYSPYNAQQIAKQWKREHERWESEYAW